MSQPPPPPPGYSDPSFGQPPPPPPGYGNPPPAYGQGTSVVVSQPMAYGYTVFREVPVCCKCPSCGADVVTSTSFEIGTITWIACLILAFVGLWLGCCLIPFCVNAAKDVVHSCPNCKNVIGKYNRM